MGTNYTVSQAPSRVVPGAAVPIASQTASSGTTVPAAQASHTSPMYRLRLLDALRRNDHAALASLVQSHGTPGPCPETESPVHMAVLCAETPTISFVIQQLHLNPNMCATDTGNTPLHLAVSSNRIDAAAFLLSLPNLNDMVENHVGKTPLTLVTSADMMKLLQNRRAELRTRIMRELEAFEASGDSSQLLATAREPRVSSTDLAVMSRRTQNNVLGAAVQAKASELMAVCIQKGLDPYAKDMNGRSADELATDTETHALLRQLANAEADETLKSGRSHSYRGFLEKYTNLVHGYKTRWFVLENGQLSYYRAPEEEGRHARGTINMHHAVVVADKREGTRFEVASSNNKDATRFYLRTHDIAECTRWVQILNKARETPESTATVQPQSSSRLSILSGSAEPDEVDDSVSETGSVEAHPELPHMNDFARVNNLMSAHFALSEELIDRLTSETGGAAAAHTIDYEGTIAAIRQSLHDRARLWREHCNMVHDREHYLQEQVERGATTRRLWEEQVDTLGRQYSEMESNLREAVAEIKRLRTEQRARGDAVAAAAPEPGDQAHADGADHSSSLRSKVGAAVGALAGAVLPDTSKPNRATSFDDMDDEFFDTVESGDIPNLHVDKELAKDEPLEDAEAQAPPKEVADKGAAGVGAAAGAGAAGAVGAEVTDNGGDAKDDAQHASKGEAPENAQLSTDSKAVALFGPGFEPYEHLRSRLPISKDERPSMSLWSILKNNIGKDLTKISFPVTFNEPTSMLERMAEDMEFSECLDAAARQEDSARRIMYVAAFAMSNYSSTIGRIAKPFNPLLGETFEYARPDREYRYVSEQVSHHPPISACFSESPRWEYMGCVDAKSKFLGRSFEIRPTGVAHARLKVSPSWVPEAVRGSLKKPRDNEDLVLEHYSWNKVTTSVSGFITGSPTMDHFGEMVVTNHATKERCVLNFMPRGWRSTNAQEIRGQVLDSSGKLLWEIAGRWSSQLIARRVGEGPESFGPDENIGSSGPIDSSKRGNHEYLLLWRNSKKYPSPFNLTPFAITLNSRPDGLVQYLPPTDCRLRPDLTAFERGKFDDADTLKVQLEELQRATRRRREAGELPKHHPRWFERTTDPDSNEPFWCPFTSKDEEGRDTMDYWLERQKVVTARQNNQPAEWDGCNKIFGDLTDA